jgi:peptide/nickel transport system substrate-binding protein
MNVLLNKLRFIQIVPRNSDDETISKKVNGTGPYSLLQWNYKSILQMVRNNNYWGKKPYFEHVLFHLNQNPDQAIQSLLSGQSQLAQCNSKKVEEISGPGKKIKSMRKDSLFLKYLGYDLKRDPTPFCDASTNPFKNKLVREAIRAGMDTRNLVLGLSSYAIPATQALPPIIFGYNPRILQAKYDPSHAISLLKQAGFPNGFNVTLHVRQQVAEAASIVKEQLARSGIRIAVKVLDDNTMLPGLRNHRYSFFLSRIGCPTGDASDILDNCFHSPDPERHYGVMNYGLFTNPEVDHAIEESAALQSIDTRRDAIQKIMSSVTSEIVWVPLYVDQDVYAMDNSLSWQPRSDSFVLASEISRVQ